MDNLRGALFMTLAMAGFAVEDAFIKLLSDSWSSGQIILALGLFGTPIFAGMCHLRGTSFFNRNLLHPAVLWRCLAEMIGTVGFITSLTLIPLSLASAILQAAPIFVTLWAALFLGEKVGWRRWSAVFAGLIGVLIILRPGFDAFDPLALFAVLGMAGLAARDIAIRRVPAAVTSLQIAGMGFVVLIPTGLLLLGVGGQGLEPVTPHSAGIFFVTLAVGVVAYSCIVTGTRVGEVGFVVPFRYTRLIFALLLGFVFFAERPDAATLIGATIVVASGLYTLIREARVRS